MANTAHFQPYTVSLYGPLGTPEMTSTPLEDEAPVSRLINQIAAGRDYREALEQAQKGSLKFETWYYQWRNALVRGEAYEISEVAGANAIAEFLSAVMEKYAPNWAECQMFELMRAITDGTPHRSLMEHGDFLFHLYQYDAQLPKRHPMKGRLLGLAGGSSSVHESMSPKARARLRLPPSLPPKTKPAGCAPAGPRRTTGSLITATS
jgi:hypothetical protein